MNYDLVVIVRSGEDQEKAKQKISTLLEKEGFHISEFETWGKKTLAYPIKKEKEGVYYSMIISADNAKPQQIYSRFRMEEAILRSLVLKKEEIRQRLKPKVKSTN